MIELNVQDSSKTYVRMQTKRDSYSNLLYLNCKFYSTKILIYRYNNKLQFTFNYKYCFLNCK